MLADSIVDWGAALQVAYISAVAGMAIALTLGVGIVSVAARAETERGGTALALNAVTVAGRARGGRGAGRRALLHRSTSSPRPRSGDQLGVQEHLVDHAPISPIRLLIPIPRRPRRPTAMGAITHRHRSSDVCLRRRLER